MSQIADADRPRMLERIVDGPEAWTQETLEPTAGALTLSPACVAELDAVAGLLRANPLPTLALRPRDFDLEACRGLMAETRAILDDGVGFVLLDRLPLERWRLGEATQLYWLLASLLARPVAQKWDGTLIYDVRDEGRPPGDGVRPDKTNVEQSYHTDNSYNLCPPTYVALLCVRTAMEGGASRIVSFATVHNELLRRQPAALARLYRPFYFDRQQEHAAGDAMVTHHALFEYDGVHLSARLSRFQIQNGQALAGLPLDAADRAALDALEAVMNEPGLAREFVFQPGQIQVLNNRLMGHKRTAFRDWPDSERRRHLVRLWLRDQGRPFYHG